MIFIRRKNKDQSITKTYSPIAKKIRRKIVDLYRPIDVYSENLFLRKIDIMAYIMVGLFSLSAIMFSLGIEFEYLPFMIGFISNVLFMVYLRFQPLTWSEMYDYEKVYFREIFFLSRDWEPKSN
jgi:hypothetical protein